MADEIITLREFARRKEVSLTAVQKACKPEVGRIIPERDQATGRITGINWTTQETAWEANAKGQFKPKNPAGGRPRNDGQPVKKAAAPLPESAPAAADQSAGAGKPMSSTDIQRARELVKLQIDSLKLKEAQKELVPAAEQEQQGQALGGAVISALYNIAERVSDELAGMTDPHAIHVLLIREFDQAVEGLRKLANAT
jgi:hypothetical protein